MNIQEAKEEIKRTLRIYTTKDPAGMPIIPPEKQRPVLLIGPPGIGKTAIMKQIAQETGKGLVSYTMTHHTRQSAIGLPMVKQRTFGHETTSVTEYTMSEIIASMHIYMEETGIREGILFLDEINCVSETLAPVMLQLLQNKTFGNHPLPEGWLIVAAGNPPEYNRSVRELDMVTLDRVKNMDIEADLDIWQNYAAAHEVHPAIRAYLTLYPDHFYRIQNTVQGQLFVTARGWEDLSIILTAYEEHSEEVTDALFLQYLQYDEIAHGFALFYRLFRRTYEDLGQNFTSPMVLADRCSGTLTAVEVLALTSLLYQRLQTRAACWQQTSRQDADLLKLLDQAASSADLTVFFADRRKALKIRYEHQLISTEEKLMEETTIRQLEEFLLLKHPSEPPAVLSDAEHSLREAEASLEAAAISEQIEETYRALEKLHAPASAFVYLTTDISQSNELCSVLMKYPSAAYGKHCREAASILS